MRTPLVLGVTVSLLLNSLDTHAQTNSWTSTTVAPDGFGGFWDDSFNWSGNAPSITQAAVLVTNAPSKRVILDDFTSAMSPNTMTISNLLISAPAGFTNTLQLLNAGSVTPLRIVNGLSIANGGVVLVTNSVLRVDGVSGGALNLDGVVLAQPAGLIVASNVVMNVGNSSGGTLTLAGGALVASNLLIATTANSTGTVWVTAGLLVVTNGVVVLGSSGVGQMTVSNGAVNAQAVTVGRNAGSQGALTIAGGTVTVSGSVILGDCATGATGNLLVSGGQLAVTSSTHSAVLDVRDGTLTLMGGALNIDKLVITNLCGHFVHTGGTLIYGTVVLDPNLSAAGDGIPNGWKQQYGLDPLDPNLGSKDTDGDGMSNLQEFLTGTDPTNSASSFRITSVVGTGSDVLVSWMTGIGKSNALQATAGGSYTTNGFIDIFTVTNASGTVTNYLDVGGATNKPARYYRVRLVP